MLSSAVGSRLSKTKMRNRSQKHRENRFFLAMRRDAPYTNGPLIHNDFHNVFRMSLHAIFFEVSHVPDKMLSSSPRFYTS